MCLLRKCRNLKSGFVISFCNSLQLGEFCSLARKKAIVRGQEPIILSNDSEPEPDVVIARNRADRYLSSHPQPADILLVIEVSDSTLKYDRTTKLSLYAETGISNYWIFKLVDNELEMHSEPYQKQNRSYSYQLQRVVLQNQTVVIPGFPELCLDLSSVFPV